MSVGATQFPDDDAVILRWEQHWTLSKDGTITRRDHKWLKLLSRRPIRSVADPRIDLRQGHSELMIHGARTHLADGTILPVPDYSFNIAAPNDVAGWPEYAAWQQRIVSFSGIETGAVLELDYELRTAPGVFPWMSADLRLEREYPTVVRIISVTVPESAAVHHKVSGLDTENTGPVQTSADGATTYRWTFENLVGAPSEPQSLPWRQRCGRLSFTTCTSANEWIAAIAGAAEAVAKADDSIATFATETIEDELDTAQRADKIAKKLHDSFNLIGAARIWRSHPCRSAAQVLRSNYGSPLEVAALYAACLRSLGLDASVEVAVDARTWDPAVPLDTALAGLTVRLDLGDGQPIIHAHPLHGRIRDPGSWGRRALLSVDKSGKLQTTYVRARGETAPSEVNISGKISIDGEGKASGDLRIHLTGGFYDPAKLETAEAQDALAKDIVGRVLGGLQVTDRSTSTLSDESLKATVSVASEKPLTSYGEHHVLQLGDGPVFLDDFPMPFDRSYRDTNVHLAGRFRENVSLVVEVPDGWSVPIVPASLPPIEGRWGTISQDVEVDGRFIRIRRNIAITTDTITPGDFATVRAAINNLRSTASLFILTGKQEPHGG